MKPIAALGDRATGLTCSRCNQATGNNTQGHFWSYCRKAGQWVGFHFCCPDLQCEPEEGDRR